MRNIKHRESGFTFFEMAMVYLAPSASSPATIITAKGMWCARLEIQAMTRDMQISSRPP